MPRYLFGPVPSRRLGRSLGLDLVPFKTCTFDCIYCQLGRTTNKTIERTDYVPVAEVLSELEEALKDEPPPDYITLSGSGEPTLHSQFEEIIAKAKEMSSVPVALLTNGSLFFQKDVRKGALRADLVLPSLDAGDETLFRYVNRPHGELSFDEIVEGLIKFRQIYSGSIWLEVFLLSGINAEPAEALQIRKLADLIKADRIQLNTAVRPTAEDYACIVKEEKMRTLLEFFGPRAEIIADYPGLGEGGAAATTTDLLELLARRPCTLDDIAAGLSIHRNEAVKFLNALEKENKIISKRRGNKVYYRKVNK